MTQDVLPHVPSAAVTANAAAKAARGSRSLRRRVYEALLEVGANGATVQQLERIVKAGYYSISPRLRELRELGLARVLPERGVIEETGCEAYLWCANPQDDADELLSRPRKARPGRLELLARKLLGAADWISTERNRVPAPDLVQYAIDFLRELAQRAKDKT